MRYSIVNWHKVVESSHSMRLDADFFRPDYMEIQNKLNDINSRRLIDLCVKVKHPKEIARKYVNSGIIFLRAQNVRPLHIDITANPVFVSDEDAEILKDNSLTIKDVLLTRTGANSGQCAIYLEDTDAIASSHVFIIKSGSINPFFLTVFLNTEYGKMLINRGKYGSSQPEVAPYFLNQIPIPVLDNLPTKIEEIYLQSYDTLQLSKESFDNAIALLLAELGLTDWRPKHQSTFIKNYSNTKQSNRIDAEYHQPKYDEIVKAVQDCSGGWDTLGNLVNLKAKNCRPKSEQEYKYIELANVRGNGEVVDCMSEEGQNLPTRARRRVSTGDVIVSSIEGSLDSVALIDKEYDQALCSTGFHVVNSLALNSETLLVILKSIIGQLQLKKGCSGTILTAINKDEFTKIALPKIKEEIQIKIQQKAFEAFSLKRQSKRLLECAKRAVEIAIEQDERRALEWLDRAALI